MWADKVRSGSVHIDNVWEKNKKKSSNLNEEESHTVKGRRCGWVTGWYHLCVEE